MLQFDNSLKRARELSWQRFGKVLTVFLPGMFNYFGHRGRYPAISITGNACQLNCDHCMATTLEPMIAAESPNKLLEKAMDLDRRGNHGILISGGCDPDGKLPWAGFIPAIREIKEKTDLFISVHCGILDDETALSLREAGIDQALLDVIGDDETYKGICHVDFGVYKILRTMESLEMAGIPIIPHILCGLFFGKMRGEKKAVEMVARFDVHQLVIVSLMPIPRTPLWGSETPKAEEVAEIIVEARLMRPEMQIGLGCARKRGDSRMEILAIDAGINRLALPSMEALSHAREYGLEVRYQSTCCSVSRDFSGKDWDDSGTS